MHKAQRPRDPLSELVNGVFALGTIGSPYGGLVVSILCVPVTLMVLAYVYIALPAYLCYRLLAVVWRRFRAP